MQPGKYIIDGYPVTVGYYDDSFERRVLGVQVHDLKTVFEIPENTPVDHLADLVRVFIAAMLASDETKQLLHQYAHLN